MMTDSKNPNDYPVYPEDDGTDRPRNPYSPVIKRIICEL
jgi:hypothetical protein